MTHDTRHGLTETPDLATLSWCLGEIRESLAASEAKLREQLAHADAQGDDLSDLRAVEERASTAGRISGMSAGATRGFLGRAMVLQWLKMGC